VPSIRLLLVDDDPDFLTLACRDLRQIVAIELVGIARDGEQALEAVERLHPDVVLMDIDMPRMNGVVATRRIKTRPDAPKVVVESLVDSSTAQEMATIAGADAYVFKGDFARQLRAAIATLFPEASSG
jgi:CheY-like chemotaxis protein